jgi:hypothetical protein
MRHVSFFLTRISRMTLIFIFLAPRLNPLSLGTIVHLTGQADFTDGTDVFLCSGVRHLRPFHYTE